MIFFGAFYSVVTVILTSLLYTVVKSMIDVYRNMTGVNASQGQAENIDAEEKVEEPDLATASKAGGGSETVPA